MGGILRYSSKESDRDYRFGIGKALSEFVYQRNWLSFFNDIDQYLFFWQIERKF